MFKVPPPDGSRHPRIEDPTNRWLVHLLGRLLLPAAIHARIPANFVSVLGFLFGAAAAGFYFQWMRPGAIFAGLALSVLWLVADGLDGMIARATGTTSATGRLLDGLCDHGVFVLLYVAMAASIGGTAWALAAAAGLAHLVQSTLYEGERIRFQRRVEGLPPPQNDPRSQRFLARIYDNVAGSLDRFSRSFELALAEDSDAGLRQAYAVRAARPLKLMFVLSNNTRVWLIFAVCAAGNPKLFWWIELLPLSLVAVTGIAWHKRVEAGLLNEWSSAPDVEGQASAPSFRTSRGS